MIEPTYSNTIISVSALGISFATILSGWMYKHYNYNFNLYDRRKKLFFQCVEISKGISSVIDHEDRDRFDELFLKVQLIYIESNFLFGVITRKYLKDFKRNLSLCLNESSRKKGHLWICKNFVDIETLIRNFPDLDISGNLFQKCMNKLKKIFCSCKERY